MFCFSFILFNELWRFLGEIETDYLTVSDSEIISLNFTVLKKRFSGYNLVYLLIKWLYLIRLDKELRHICMHVITTLMASLKGQT